MQKQMALDKRCFTNQTSNPGQKTLGSLQQARATQTPQRNWPTHVSTIRSQVFTIAGMIPVLVTSHFLRVTACQ